MLGGFPRDLVLRALELARWAPSAHNTQPWTVQVSPERIVVRAEAGRHLAHTDPSRRDLHLSLGAFTEALVIALAGEGARFERTDAPAGAFAAPAGEREHDRATASLVRRRQTSRLAYSAREPETAALDALAGAAREQRLSLHLIPRGTPERARMEDWLFAASRESWLDRRAVAELAKWIRLDPEGVRRPEDGLSTHCLDLGAAESVALALLLRDPLWRAVHAAPLLASKVAASETDGAERAPFFAVLVADGNAGAQGAGMLRVWLEATKARLALQPLSVLLDRRGWELARHLGASHERLVAVFRLGLSAPPPRAGRRPVGRFVTESQ